MKALRQYTEKRERGCWLPRIKYCWLAKSTTQPASRPTGGESFAPHTLAEFRSRRESLARARIVSIVQINCAPTVSGERERDKKARPPARPKLICFCARSLFVSDLHLFVYCALKLRGGALCCSREGLFSSKTQIFKILNAEFFYNFQ
jgi:hypothetical protein